MGKPLPSVFIEIHPFHAVTLYYYYANLADIGCDAVFANSRLFEDELFQQIECPKEKLGLGRLLRHIMRENVETCYYNTINMTLFPLTRETLLDNARLLIYPLLTHIIGCKNAAIVHEANHFYDTGERVDRRTRLFRVVIGWWYIRLFAVKYTLSTEVRDFLTSIGKNVAILDATPLASFSALEPRSEFRDVTAGKKVICWIGPVVTLRRSSDELVQLSAAVLKRTNVVIVMLCDITVGDGPPLQQRLLEAGLENYFVFLPNRPTDTELFGWVKRSVAVFCLYGSEPYGRSKTSGARIIASGLHKPFICNKPTLGLYAYDGSCLEECVSMDECIEAISRHIPD